MCRLYDISSLKDPDLALDWNLPGAKMRLVVVEDNIALADGIARSFRGDGHAVDEIYAAQPAMNFIIQEDVDLVILDIKLPDLSGFEVLAEIRRHKKDLPVLMLTAKSELNDKIQGLDAGADDYLTKPFDLDELKARVRALLRRRTKSQVDVINIKALEFDLTKRKLFLGGRDIALPRKELALLELLIARPEHVISKAQIIDHLYGSGSDIEESTIEIYIHRLRKRLAGSGVEIRTLRGLGYCLQEVR